MIQSLPPAYSSDSSTLADSLMLPGTRYWMGVVSADHADRAISQGIAQTCHGKAYPLSRMKAGDWLIYYSPRAERSGGSPVQAFTAIGQALDDRVYRQAMSETFVPHRRDMRYLPAKPVRIAGLLEQLSFTRGRRSWGQAFRFGQFEIEPDDFRLIAGLMLEGGEEDSLKQDEALCERQLEFEW